MNIDRKDSTISFSFESKDWRYRDIEGFLTAFKRAVPSEMRSYDPDTKVWDFSKNYEGVFDQLFDEHLRDNSTPMMF